MSNTDALNRIPLNETYSTPVLILGEILWLINLLESSLMYAKSIKQWTCQDPEMSRVLTFIHSGWANKAGQDTIQPYFTHKDEITVHDGCLLWGQQIIIPVPGRKRILEELYNMHPGVYGMKVLARSYVWWPGIDKYIEICIQSCLKCQLNQKMLTVAPLNFWEFP